MQETNLSEVVTLDPAVVGHLAKFNIRTVEQLLVYRDSERRVEMLSLSLHMSTADVITMLDGLVKTYPKAKIPATGFKPRGLGFQIETEQIKKD